MVWTVRHDERRWRLRDWLVFVVSMSIPSLVVAWLVVVIFIR